MRAHANDLRAEVAKDFSIADDEEADRLVAQVSQDWHKANLKLPDRALCAYADKLTRTPESMSERDVQELRDHGWSDPAIHDATQVIAYFNYINRIADGLGVDLETDSRKWEEG